MKEQSSLDCPDGMCDIHNVDIEVRNGESITFPYKMTMV